MVHLPAVQPFAHQPLLTFLRGRALAGIETVTEDGYHRHVALPEGEGTVDVRVSPAGLDVELDPALAPVRDEVLDRLRSLFDLDAPAPAIDAALSAHPALRASVQATPGRRVPGAFDPWELALRCIIGQQVSVAAATTVCGRMMTRLGRPTRTGWRPPRPEEIDSIDAVAACGMPGARAATIVALAQAVREGRVPLHRGADPHEVGRTLRTIRGIGDWTADYVTLRAYGQRDHFLPGDLAARKALGATTIREAEALSQPWRPWRAYALMHVWSAGAGG